MQLFLFECSANLPSASITRWFHSCNFYHFFYNLIKRENISICLLLSRRYCNEVTFATIICPCVNTSPFKNLPLNFFFVEAAVLRLKVNCKTFFVVILNEICVLALNIRVNSLRENYSRNYKNRLKKTLKNSFCNKRKVEIRKIDCIANHLQFRCCCFTTVL